MENLFSQNSGFYKLINVVRVMVAVEPVIINMIAMGLGFAILLLLNHSGLFPKLGIYQFYFKYLVCALITIQMIRSSTKSLFIPFLILAVAGIAYLAPTINPNLHFLKLEIIQQLMLLGVIGIGGFILFAR
jgi:hypothetical protein